MLKRWTYRFEEQKAQNGPFGSTESWSGYVVYTDEDIFFEGYATEEEALRVINNMNGDIT